MLEIPQEVSVQMHISQKYPSQWQEAELAEGPSLARGCCPRAGSAAGWGCPTARYQCGERGLFFSLKCPQFPHTHGEKVLVPMALVKNGFYVGAGGVNQLQKSDFGKTSFHPSPQELSSRRSISVKSTQALQYSGIKLLKHCGINPGVFCGLLSVCVYSFILYPLVWKISSSS